MNERKRKSVRTRETLAVLLFAFVFVLSVYVCERENDRESKRERESVRETFARLSAASLSRRGNVGSMSYGPQIYTRACACTCICVCTCVCCRVLQSVAV